MSEISMPQCWHLESKPHKFCPGCGHGIILKALGMAIDELEIQDRTVFGCDIGCSLLAWNFFDLDSIQTHHGRTTPVIVGLKRANPELIGIAYMGDGGGYAIGLQHLMSAAIRNELITVILANNTVYAMTGGQMAPTTLPEQKTETSPFGRKVKEAGKPVNGPEMLAAVADDNAYIARGSISKVLKLKQIIKKALKNQSEGRGFSFVEVLSSCPTNWRTNAKDTWSYLEKEMSAYYKVKEFSRTVVDEKINI
ncbi:MAG: thiamine pyrophosphate-dependent enzyme [Dethiobacteria bacterium]|jgi:2-oxoglutarate ferredoxin oxidoreductase subunit beta